MLHAAAAKLEQIDGERRKLEARLRDVPAGRDLESEFESLGAEISAILQSAREAAESMRQRASLDSARWRNEAMADAETGRKEAAADAEALRRDAWVTGSELLQQSSAAAEAMRANAERDVLTVMGEAEREAHRLTSGARREAEDLMRNTTMEAEKIIADAAKRRDEIIDGANRQAATAQERTRALEHRRDELLEELENVRSTLARLEGSLEERREALELTTYEPSNVRVVHPPAEAKRQWELGETVRVIHTDDRPPHPSETIGDEISAEVARIQEGPADEASDAPPEPTAAAPVAEPEQRIADQQPAPPPAPQSVLEPEPAPEEDEVESLFAALRGDGGPESAPDASVQAEEQRAPDEPNGAESSVGIGKEDADKGVDWHAVRESRLLPITNRALRGVKKAMSDVQNHALDSIRTDETWRPDEASITEALHAEIVAVWSESFAAGHAVAEQMAGSKLKRPPTPNSEADHKFASDLASAVGEALGRAGDGPRERQSAASRVFRVWRSDEAERRIRDLALSGYETGIEESRRTRVP